MKTLVLSVTLLAGGTQLANATGLHTCESGDRANWQSSDTLQQKLIDEGWKVRKIKEDGGCYEVYGTTPEGQRGEAYFHPETLELEIVARRGKILFKRSE